MKLFYISVISAVDSVHWDYIELNTYCGESSESPVIYSRLLNNKM